MQVYSTAVFVIAHNHKHVQGHCTDSSWLRVKALSVVHGGFCFFFERESNVRKDL